LNRGISDWETALILEATVRRIDRTETDAVLDLLTLAFASDPCARYAWPSPAEYLRAYPRLALALGGRGLEHGAAYATGAFDAAALWLPPGVEPDADAVGELIEDTLSGERQAVIGEVAAQMDQFHPKEPHWYLAMIGVDPARQGRGLGSALLKHTLARCDEQRSIAYLESSNPRNVPLYERHGFEVLGLIQPHDFPPLIPMLRMPAA
jgi:ribosomal protein S18 acetylase RimI-like enzyme